MNWVCSGFGRDKLGLFGFVLAISAKSFIFIILCYKITYVHLDISEIGFVFHNCSLLIDRSF